MRTPLTAMRGHAQLLQRRAARQDVLPSPQITPFVAEIDRSSRAMERMIGDLLDLSRIEAGRPLELNLRRLNLVRLLRDLVVEQQLLSTRHQIVFKSTSE